jgi:hypothetical protein
MHIPTLTFAVVVVCFLIGLVISAVRINVMAELDEAEVSQPSNLEVNIWDLSAGVAETSSDAIDGEQ